MQFPSSIRQKITFGYYAIVAAIVGLSAFTVFEINYVERKVMFGEVIAEFFDATLEARRFEKNYFLYGEDSDYRENIRYLAKARDLIEGNLPGFRTVAASDRIDSLRNNLREYRELMDSYAQLPARERGNAQAAALGGRIREQGKEIVTASEDISRAERRNLQALLSNSQRVLIVSILILALVVIVIGQVLSRMVVRPLKSLEESMRQIAEGRFETVSIRSDDREIVSLTKAFNTMLRELELRQRHLVQSEKLASLGTLLSGVAHELNNPLSNISSSCQILIEEIGEADVEYRKELLAQIEGQTDRARNIVRSLLEFSREREFKKEKVFLRGLFEETIRFLRGQVPSRVSITVAVPDDLTVMVDKQRTQQAFLNILKNAVEAVGEEGEISIKARRHMAVDKAEKISEIYTYLKYRGKCTIGGDTVDVEIRDTGPGIPPEIIPRVFDPFFTTKDVGKGSGLGLFIVHEIIEENDGCIAVDSEAGKGTVFYISLPMTEEGRT